MKIFVTGGAGYVGSILTEKFLTFGDEVTVVDNFMYGQASLAHLCMQSGLKIVRGDARDMRVVVPLVAKADVVIPLAAIVGAPACDADMTAAHSTNLQAVVDLLNMMSAEQRMVIPITNSGYGVGEPGVECTEDSPLRPVSAYGQIKVMAEEMVLERGNAVSLRLATVFGMSPRMRLDLLVNDFVWRAVTDRAVVLFEAGFKRNYVHVRDVARAFVHVLDHWDDMRDKVFNVGMSDANLSKRELCERIKQVVPEFRFLEAEVGSDPDKRDYVVSNARIEKTGWHPRWSLDDGIRELVKGYQMLRRTAHGNV